MPTTGEKDRNEVVERSRDNYPRVSKAVPAGRKNAFLDREKDALLDSAF